MGLKVPVIYDTLSDLTSDPNAVGGMIVKTLGEEAIGDGKGRTYKVYDPSMGKPYDHTKHILLSKTDVFAEIVEDNPLYGKVTDMQEDIDELKQSGQVIDTSNFMHVYSTVAAMQADTSLRVGINCKTLGEETLGDGKGRTYKIYAYDIEHGLYDDQIPMTNPNIVAQLIVESIAESRSASNEEKITALTEAVEEDVAAINDSIAQTYGTLKESVETGYLRIYNTYAEFIAAEDIAAGMTVKTLGEETLGDGKGRTYKVWDQNSGQPYDPEVNIDLALEGFFAEEFEDNAVYQQVRDNTFNISQMSESMETMEGQINDLSNSIESVGNTVENLSITVNDNYNTLESKMTRPYDIASISAMDTAGIALRKYSNGVKQVIVKAWPEDAVLTGEEHTVSGEGYEISYIDDEVVLRIRLDVESAAEFNVNALSLFDEGDKLDLRGNITVESYHIDEPVPEPEPEPDSDNPDNSGDDNSSDPILGDGDDPDNPDDPDDPGDDPVTIRVNCIAFNITRTTDNVVCNYI